MGFTRITDSDVYNIKKYVDLDVGIKEVCPALSGDYEIEELCLQLQLTRRTLIDEIERRVDKGE